MFRRRRAKGMFFAPGPDYWALKVRDRYGEALLELTKLLPAGQTFFLEGIATVPLIASYLEARPAADLIEVRSGTIWPRGRSFHMPMTEENMAGLVELMDHVAEPEVGDHLHAYNGTTAYLVLVRRVLRLAALRPKGRGRGTDPEAVRCARV